MNLSSYLQMPPAPSVSTNTSHTLPQGTRTGFGTPAGANLGFDFAQVMARQMARLVPQERPTFAADVPEPPEAATARAQDSRAVEDKRNTERPEDDASQADNNSDVSTAHTRQRNKTNKGKPTDADALLESLMQGAPVMPASTLPVTVTSIAAEPGPQAQAASALAAPVSLQTIELSPQMRIITDPKKAPSPESLAAFAKSMGLDESEIRNLLSQQPATPATGLTSVVQASHAQDLAIDLPQTSSTTLQATISTVLSGAPQGSESGTDSTLATQPVAMTGITTLTTPSNMASIQQLQSTALPLKTSDTNTFVSSTLNAMTATAEVSPTTGTSGAGLAAGNTTLTGPSNTASTQQLQSTVLPLKTSDTNTFFSSTLDAMTANAEVLPTIGTSGAGLAAAATTLAAPTLSGLTATDMASIQQLQITVLPAAVLPIQTAANITPLPSTIDMLSLLSTGVNEQDVSALLSRFSEDAGSESNPDQQPSQGEGNNFSSFSQALSNTKNAVNTAPANAAQATNANMSEVYDQLSDKMATELAARMHKQLNDGEWKMKFGLRPSNLGGVEIQLEMKDGKLDAVFRADNPLTRDLLQNSSQRLREALANFGINSGQVNVGQGGGNSTQNGSGNSGKQSQVRDNSSSQVNGSSSATSNASGRNKANASLLDLYA